MRFSPVFSRLLLRPCGGEISLFRPSDIRLTMPARGKRKRALAANKSSADQVKKAKIDDDAEPEKVNQQKDNEVTPEVVSCVEPNAVTNVKIKHNLKIASWNVNGIRSWLNAGAASYVEKEKPDILCLQETKCPKEKLPKEGEFEGYESYWFPPTEKVGYAGTGFYTKTKPLNVTYGIGKEKHDSEGRVITAEYEKFNLVTAYVPNSGRGLPRLNYRYKEWDVDFNNYLKELDNKKPVILCGDLNVAHKEIDLKSPKTNAKTAGFTKEEREGFTNLLEMGFVDSFRHFYPDKTEAYTYWSAMRNSRARNIGWRMDYFVVSGKLTNNLCDSIIHQDAMGSDHCPIMLLLNV